MNHRETLRSPEAGLKNDKGGGEVFSPHLYSLPYHGREVNEWRVWWLDSRFRGNDKWFGKFLFALYRALRSWILTSLAFASTYQGGLWMRCARGCVAALVV